MSLLRKKIRFYLDRTDKTMHKYETDLVKNGDYYFVLFSAVELLLRILSLNI